MNKLLALLLLPLFAGCLTAESTDVTQWTLVFCPKNAAAGTAKYGIARISHVSIRAPYRSKSIVVYRADGSVALDAYNEFAAEPMMLMRGVVADALEGCGLFKSVVSSTSLAKSDVSVEVDITSLALDCRGDGASSRKAVADLVIRLVDSAGGILTAAKGSASVPAAEPNFGAALSQACSQALEQAIGRLD